MSWEDFRSVRKEPMSMECRRRKEWSVGGGSGVGLIDSLVKTGKWSDRDKWVKETSGASKVSEEVMTRSRMWFLSCVGKWTCWLRLKEERRDRNWEVRVSAGLSTWMLKSPVMINSWGVVAAEERKELKSSVVYLFVRWHDIDNWTVGLVVVIMWVDIWEVVQTLS